MKHPRMAAAAALSSLVLVTACSDAQQDEPAADTATSSESSTAADSDSADQTAQTAEPEDESQSTAAAEGVGVISLEQAEKIATDLLTKAAKVNNRDGRKIEGAAAAAFRGHAETSARAADTLEEVTGKPKKRNLEANPIEPNVLAISRDDGQTPLLLLVQTVPKSGPPELHVMASPNRQPDNFRIVWSAPMLPGTDIGTFDRRSQGSPILRKGKGDLARSPQKLLSQLTDYIDYPPGDAQEFKTNGYAPQVRVAADAQADEVAQQAQFSETNTAKDKTFTFFREDGSAVTFATLDRSSDFDVRPGMELTPPEEFLVFQNDASITRQASLSSFVYVAVTVPTGSDRSEMIAAREQLVDANGS